MESNSAFNSLIDPFESKKTKGMSGTNPVLELYPSGPQSGQAGNRQRNPGSEYWVKSDANQAGLQQVIKRFHPFMGTITSLPLLRTASKLSERRASS